MTYIDALIMGLVQGLTEFLPISSSGHLVLYARLTGTESNVGFDVAVHLATLIAVVLCFRKQVAETVKRPFSPRSRLLWLATLCSAISVLATKDLALKVFDNAALLPIFFMLTAVLLTIAAIFPHRTEHPIGALDAAVIGFAQGFATFPALSRSGTTISVGTMLGVQKEENVSFCFLLSIPIIIASAVVRSRSVRDNRDRVCRRARKRHTRPALCQKTVLEKLVATVRGVPRSTFRPAHAKRLLFRVVLISRKKSHIETNKTVPISTL